MLDFRTEITKKFTDSSLIEVSDVTVYGGSNPERNDLAVVLLYFKRSAENVDTPIDVDNSAPNTTTVWQVEAPNDGWYRGYLFAIPVYDNAETYSLGHLVFYNGDIYQSISESDISGTNPQDGIGVEWQLYEGDFIEIFDDGNTNVEWGVVNNNLYRDVEKCLSDRNESLSEDVLCDDKVGLEKLVPNLTYGALLNAAKSKFLRNKYAESQRIIDYLLKKCAC
jgi:hypothetical protein